MSLTVSPAGWWGHCGADECGVNDAMSDTRAEKTRCTARESPEVHEIQNPVALNRFGVGKETEPAALLQTPAH